MRAMPKLVSVIICSYRKFEYIYQAIDSVLCQTYEAIELLISDDGSGNFPEQEIRRYVEEHKRENLKCILCNHEAENLGTVKHLNHAIRLVHGDYIGILAADDAYFDECVLERFVRGFEKPDVAPDCYIEMAQTAMCDHTLRRIDGYALFQNVREAVEKGGNELFELVAFCACLPTTSFFYKKQFFEKYGPFDEELHLVEDYPMHCTIAREGWKIHYENFAAARHRSGGISHGNVGGLSRSAYLYETDLLKIREKYVEPYYEMLGEKAREEVKDRVWEDRKRIKSTLLLYDNSKEARKQYVREYRWHICKERLCASWQRLWAFAAELFQMAFFLMLAIPQLSTFLGNPHADRMYLFGWGMAGLSAVCWFCAYLGKITERIERFPWEIGSY